MTMSDVTTVILTGGRSSRMGGGDKTQSLVGSTTLLDLLVGTLPSTMSIVVVGAQAPTDRDVVLCREEPEFGGPVAALAAGLKHVATPLTFVVAGDRPRSGNLLERLHSTRAEIDSEAAVPLDADDRVQHMCFLVRTSALNRAIESLDTPVNAAVRSVFDELDITTVQLSPDEQVSLVDVNTPEDLAALRSQQG